MIFSLRRAWSAEVASSGFDYPILVVSDTGERKRSPVGLYFAHAPLVIPLGSCGLHRIGRIAFKR